MCATQPDSGTPDYLTFAYFPYIFMGDLAEITLGGSTVWNLDMLAGERIPDAAARKVVLRLAETNRVGSRPLKGMGVLQIGGRSLFAPSELQGLAMEAERARLMLFLLQLTSNLRVGRGENAGLYIRTSENCSVFLQSFTDGTYTGERAGFVVMQSIGGRRVDKTVRQVPDYVLTNRFLRSPDARFVAHVLRLERDRPSRFRQILAAADSLFESYRNAGG